MINCIAIDDTPLALEKLERFVAQVPFLNLLMQFGNGIEAIAYLRENKVDLVFLDIQMELLSGIQFLESLDSKPQIIIVSAYSQYAVDGFNHSVADYLLKPYSFERFLKAIDRVRSNMLDKPVKNFMFVKSEYKMVRIDFHNILYIEGKGAYLYIVSKDSKTMTLMTFAEIEALLPTHNFARTHKSFMVAIDKIENIENNTIVIDNQRIPIGRTYIDRFYQKLENSQ